MSDFELDQLLRALAAAFKARGMKRHVAALRVFYKGYAERKRTSAGSDKQTLCEDDVIEWLRIMRVAPFDRDYPLLPSDAGCPKCQAPAAVGFVVSMWADGSKKECQLCHARWVVQLPDVAVGAVPLPSARKPQR